jgi:hypothetical protein
VILTPIQRLYVSNFGVATPNANGNYLVDFVDMCKKVAAKRSTKCIDMYRDSGINQTNLYFYTVEGVHPVNQGFARMRGAVIPILDEMFALEYEPFGTMINTGDTEPDEPEAGGGSGENTPPEEEPDDNSVPLDFVYDATIYDWYVAEPDKIGDAGYDSNSKYVSTGAIALTKGKTYTVTTYQHADYHYWGLTNGAETYGSYGADGKWVANRVGGTNLTKGSSGVSSEDVTINGTAYKKVTWNYAPTSAIWLWFSCARGLEEEAKLTFI